MFLQVEGKLENNDQEGGGWIAPEAMGTQREDLERQVRNRLPLR